MLGNEYSDDVHTSSAVKMNVCMLDNIIKMTIRKAHTVENSAPMVNGLDGISIF